MGFRKYEEAEACTTLCTGIPTHRYPEKWSELTDDEIQTDVLSDYRRWIHDGVGSESE